MTENEDSSSQKFATDVHNVIKSMLWCHGVPIPTMKANPELPHEILKLLEQKLKTGCENKTFEQIVENLAENLTDNETMGRLLCYIRIHSENKKGISKSSFEWSKPSNIVENNLKPSKKSMSDDFRRILMKIDETKGQVYYRKCVHFDLTPSRLKVRDMKRQDDITKDMLYHLDLVEIEKLNFRKINSHGNT